MFRPMKPETIARRAAERFEARAVAKQDRIARLKALIERDGARSVWADLLAEETER